MDTSSLVYAALTGAGLCWWAASTVKARQRTQTAIAALWLITKMPSEAKQIAFHTLAQLGERSDDRGPIP